MESRIEELERELKETSEQLALTREQLRLQSRRARQLVAACSTKVEEKEREMRMLRVLKDGQLQSIVRKLLHFESLLRQEQKRVVEIVRQKDQIIRTQSTELDQLRQANRKLLMAASQDPDDSSSASNPAASKMAKLDPENKENVGQNESQTKANQQQQLETPLVTKMVRRFEPAVSTAASKKPEIPKKPARLLAAVAPTPAVAIQQPVTVSKGVVRTDSVNDHGYFTLEKRKPVRMSVTPTPVQVTEPKLPNPTPRDPPSADHVADEMDLRHNFEEFHLMDSLEEEEQQQQQQQQQQQLLFQQHSETTIMTTTPPRTPDRSSGDGAEWNSSSASSGGSSSLQLTPPHNGMADCTSLSICASSVQILPQLGDATPTSGVQFDRFLDVSGLTQKSILTPSRLLSNHKNMLKPKDVKHRHMINKATHAHAPNAFNNCRSSESLLLSAAGDSARLHHHHHSTNQVRYYVEPFL
ncbi:transcription factor SPT20 homolog [Daphnia carinata]|uniref:transcription factor SPT20 homolog n=1 Tax=Daphnia carinata TaxID=120202 RepID=UPI00257FF90A|nr:transcription factor SPT20 homolog [Daphnia carinata]